VCADDESALAGHLRVLLKRLRPDCVIDVGGNTGQFGRLLRGLGYRGWIVSFEPVRQSFDRLENFTSGDPRWRVHRLAIGSIPETRRMNVSAMSEFSSFRTPTTFSLERFRGESEVQHVEDVRVVRLDDCEAECLQGIPSSRLFLKVDTQGWDLEVLRGAAHLIDRCEVLQVELSLIPVYRGVPMYVETLGYVSRLGFSPTGFFPITRDEFSRLIEVDCVLVRTLPGY
jgi:FkbM family methyltransferase